MGDEVCPNCNSTMVVPDSRRLHGKKVRFCRTCFSWFTEAGDPVLFVDDGGDDVPDDEAMSAKHYGAYLQCIYALKADLEKLGCRVEISEYEKDGDDWLEVQIIYPPGVHDEGHEEEIVNANDEAPFIPDF